MKILSHAALLVAVDLKDDGRVIVPNMSKEGYPGRLHAMETGETGESVGKTLWTCAKHEMAKDASDFSWENLGLVCVGLGPDKQNPKGYHAKFAHAISITSGYLRDYKVADPPDVLLAFEYRDFKNHKDWDLRHLLDHMEQVRTAPFHQFVTANLVHFVCNRDEKIYNRYSDLYSKYQPQKLSDAAWDAIDEYLAEHPLSYVPEIAA